MDLFRKKSVDQLVAESTPLKRTMRTFDLTMLGIGAIIGTGIFVLTGKGGALTGRPGLVRIVPAGRRPAAVLPVCATPSRRHGPGVRLGLLLCLSGVRRAHRLRDRWDLILEYALQAATVSAGWSGLLQQTAGRLRPAPAGRADRRLRHQPGRHHLLQPARFRHRAHHHVGALHRHQPDQAHQ